jgi:endonuclease/exonuclease/phosphatase family metal-dependent hydrolase
MAKTDALSPFTAYTMLSKRPSKPLAHPQCSPSSGSCCDFHPRQQTIDDLIADVHRRQNNQETVIIVGDFNEQLDNDPNLIASTCAQFNLFEALDYHHREEAMVPTYIHGSKRLDYEFLQQELKPFLLASASDHQRTKRPVLVRLLTK